MRPGKELDREGPFLFEKYGAISVALFVFIFLIMMKVDPGPGVDPTLFFSTATGLKVPLLSSMKTLKEKQESPQTFSLQTTKKILP